MSDAAEQHPHYYVDVTGLTRLDIYRLQELFETRYPAIDHAIKKLLVAGQRGHKDAITDVKDAIKSLNRWLEMRAEDEARLRRPPPAHTEITIERLDREDAEVIRDWNNAFGALTFSKVTVNFVDGLLQGATLDGHEVDRDTCNELVGALSGPISTSTAVKLMKAGQALVNARGSETTFGFGPGPTTPIPGWIWRPFGVRGQGSWASAGEPSDRDGPFYVPADNALQLIRKVRGKRA